MHKSYGMQQAKTVRMYLLNIIFLQLGKPVKKVKSLPYKHAKKYFFCNGYKKFYFIFYLVNRDSMCLKIAKCSVNLFRFLKTINNTLIGIFGFLAVKLTIYIIDRIG